MILLNKRTGLLVSCLLSAGCENGVPQGAGAQLAGGTHDLRLARIEDKPIDSLSRHEARFLCIDELERTDYCAQAALRATRDFFSPFEDTDLPALCAETRADCDQRFDPAAARRACREAASPPAGSCSVTVGQFQACLDAWTQTQTCDNAGRLIETPEACAELNEDCASYLGEFFQDGAPPACEPVDADDVPPDEDDDIHGLDTCRPLPDRFVVLGDSIATCFVLSGDSSCSVTLMHQQLQQTVAPEVQLEWHAVGGAVTADLPVQMLNVEPGPGHVAVWVYAIGNDLLLGSRDPVPWQQSWQEVYAYFTDESLFPDGATFMLNTQYSPYDRCPDPGGDRSGIPIEDEDALVEINQLIFLDPAEARDDTLAIDQYPDWLGHATNADIGACPHCGVDNTSWMLDGIHPNAAGHRHIAEKWARAFEQMYSSDCD